MVQRTGAISTIMLIPPVASERPMPAKRLALVAHDQKKPALAEWVGKHLAIISAFDIVCTGTTGGVLLDAYPRLRITRLKSGPLGGDQQIGSLIVDGDIRMLIFFIDPLSPMPHDVDVKALTRLATLYDVPLAMSPATADLVIAGLVPAKTKRGSAR
jgi:methylglyoxal synthase